MTTIASDVPKNDLIALRAWFLEHKRDLPWRLAPSPYSVWVSEVMLQQTQVSVVIPYYINWMRRFPTLKAVAESSWDEILKHWEGLGYYARAKNLQRGAQYIMETANGVIPTDANELLKVPGLGPYTVNAIRAFAFKQKTAAVDGNVMRVLARYLNYQEDLSKNKNQTFLRNAATAFILDDEPWVSAEALIELGALVCKKKPHCLECPLKSNCNAFRNGTQQLLPYKSQANPVIHMELYVAVIEGEDGLLIRKVPEGQVLSGLHEFPYSECADAESFILDMEKKLALKLELGGQLPPVKHTFTKYKAHLKPLIFKTATTVKFNCGYFWASNKVLEGLAFSSGHRRILRQFASCSFKYL